MAAAAEEEEDGLATPTPSPTPSPGPDGDGDGDRAASGRGAGPPHAAAAAAAPAKPRPPPALPWMRVPVPIGGGSIPLGDVRGLDGRIEGWLRGAGFTTLFPVQAATWSATAGGRGGAHDLAVCAPTGSGKTLAYALPLVHALLAEVVARSDERPSTTKKSSKRSSDAVRPPLARRPPRLGALVVVPTRDLAAQVHGVLAGLCEAAARGGVLLSAALVTGAASPTVEAVALAGAACTPPPPLEDYPWPPGAADLTPRPADAVVATPGRLASHLAALGPARARAALSSLRLLVVDEADRLLRQEYGGWAGVLGAALPPPGSPTAGGAGPRTVRLAASATLTRDPSRLAALGLWRPRYLATVPSAAGARYALPPGLVDWRVDVPGAGGSANKPAALVALLRQLSGGGGGVAARALRSTTPSAPSLGPALIFASSVATASSVTAFLSALDPPLPGGPVALLARGVSPPQRAAALAAFSAGALAALVASDGAARGLDFTPPPSTAIIVISYDPPGHAKVLVHRAGRAARAGAAGAAFTLLTGPEAAPFKRVRAKVAGGGVGREWGLVAKGDGGREEWAEAKAQARAAVERVGVGGGV